MIKVKGSPLYQWEVDRQLLMDSADAVKAVFVSNSGDKDALTVEPKEENGAVVANIPNILLQSGRDIVVHYCRDKDGVEETVFGGVFDVRPRAKPADYIYTETEVLSYRTLENRLNQIAGEGLTNAVNDALAKAKASGEFDGDDYVLTEDDKEEIAGLAAEKVEVPEGGGIAVTGATVGQTVKISAVDENGVPTAWEAVEFPSENSNRWEQLDYFILGEDTTKATRSQYSDGTEYNLSAVKVIAKFFYPLTLTIGSRVDLYNGSKQIASIVLTINTDTRDNPSYHSTGIYQAKPVSGLYEFIGAKGNQGGEMTTTYQPNANFQNVSTDNKITRVDICSWLNVLPAGTAIEIYGVRA